MFQRAQNDKRINRGLQLAQGPWKSLCEDLLQKDEYRASVTALLLENTYNFIALNEDTKMANVGTFDKFAMPIIRAVFPNLIATDIVSVQPMDGPVSLVFFLETRYATTKGSATAGQTNLSALTGHNSQYSYSSELIDSELIFTGTAAAGETNHTATLGWTPVRPSTLKVYVNGVLQGADDGNGSMAGAGLTGTNTINYTTGAIEITLTADVPDTQLLTVEYGYDSEGNETLPQIDLMLSHAPVQAHPNKLRARWSVESAQDLKAVHNLDAEEELMAFLAEELRFEIDRTIIQDLTNIAAAAPTSWDKTPPDAALAYYDHKLSFVDYLVESSNLVFAKTKRAAANWAVVGTGISNIIESLPNFQPTNIDGAGVVHMGNLNGRWEIYKDPWMSANSGIMGYRGNSFADAGYVYAPYVPLYRTPTIYLDDMIGRVGLMSRYGKKLVNDDFFQKIEMIQS